MSHNRNTNEVAVCLTFGHNIVMNTTQGTSPYAGSAIERLERIDKLDEFTHYCCEFYLFGGDEPSLYPFATDHEICDAVMAHMTDPNPLFPFDGDSTDREAVRDRILAVRKLLGSGEADFDKAVAMGKCGIHSQWKTYAETLEKMLK